MLIKNGSVVTERVVVMDDVRIDGELIAEIGGAIEVRDGEQVINATGKVVIPGGVDVHTHMDLDLGHVRSTDDFYTGTVAAACGGTTTIVDHMASGEADCSLRSRVEAYHKLAEGKAVVDYGFHGVLNRVDDGVLSEIGELSREGITSHKFYLTYSGMISDKEVMALMDRASALGVLLAVHAENDGAISYLKGKYLGEGKTTPIYHARSRPPECEAEAVSRMLHFADMVGDAPLYVVHLTTGMGLRHIRVARERGQRNIFAETCPQYLLLDESMYKRDDGLKYIMSPPLRTPDNCGALWDGIASKDIDVIGTDHCPFFYGKEKQWGKDDFTKAPGGMPGVEARIPLMYSEVASGRLSIEEFVALCCTTPARLFGMYPKKGAIAVGSDADLVVIDPSARVTLTKEMLHENTDYTPYEGRKLSGYPILTISRGEVIMRDGKFVGKAGRGQFQRRGLPELA